MKNIKNNNFNVQFDKNNCQEFLTFQVLNHENLYSSSLMCEFFLVVTGIWLIIQIFYQLMKKAFFFNLVVKFFLFLENWIQIMLKVFKYKKKMASLKIFFFKLNKFYESIKMLYLTPIHDFWTKIYNLIPSRREIIDFFFSYIKNTLDQKVHYYLMKKQKLLDEYIKMEDYGIFNFLFELTDKKFFTEWERIDAVIAKLSKYQEIQAKAHQTFIKIDSIITSSFAKLMIHISDQFDLLKSFLSYVCVSSVEWLTTPIPYYNEVLYLYFVIFLIIIITLFIINRDYRIYLNISSQLHRKSDELKNI